MDTQVVTVSSKGQITLPTAEEFRQSLKEAQEWAASVGYVEEDVNDIIKSVRQSKHV